jgi:hypothetical protein
MGRRATRKSAMILRIPWARRCLRPSIHASGMKEMVHTAEIGLPVISGSLVYLMNIRHIPALEKLDENEYDPG